MSDRTSRNQRLLLDALHKGRRTLKVAYPQSSNDHRTAWLPFNADHKPNGHTVNALTRKGRLKLFAVDRDDDFVIETWMLVK